MCKRKCAWRGCQQQLGDKSVAWWPVCFAHWLQLLSEGRELNLSIPNLEKALRDHGYRLVRHHLLLKRKFKNTWPHEKY